MEMPRVFRIFLVLIVLFFFLPPFSINAATNQFIPEVTWLRSTESSSGVQISSAHGRSLFDAYQIPLDPNQVVWDNGMYTPEVNKQAVPEGVEWASWPSYQEVNPYICSVRKYHTFRHMRATFDIPESINLQDITGIKLRSPPVMC
jgi:hypothetical protein